MLDGKETGDRKGAGLCGERSNVPRDNAALYEAVVIIGSRSSIVQGVQ